LIYHCSRRLLSASRLAKDEEGVEKKKEKSGKKGVRFDFRIGKPPAPCWKLNLTPLLPWFDGLSLLMANYGRFSARCGGLRGLPACQLIAKK
jgi:hypothetical protein